MVDFVLFGFGSIVGVLWAPALWVNYLLVAWMVVAYSVLGLFLYVVDCFV